jgi:[ribosomal protein S5]-alanine N-acetyltransferase
VTSKDGEGTAVVGGLSSPVARLLSSAALMAFFRSVSLSDPVPAIPGEGIVLRAPQMSDCPQWISLREASREFLTPWEPIWPADDLTRPAFRRRIKRYSDDQRSDLSYAFFIFRKRDDALIGGLTLANIRRGCAQAGSLGYWMGEPYARQGHMTAAVNAIIPFAFGSLKLHRIEAACIPANLASVRLLEKTGFKREGFARQYLCINGSWQDHLLFSRLKAD